MDNWSGAQPNQWEHEDTNELPTKTTKILDNVSVWMIENVMQFAVVLDEIVPIKTDTNVIVKVQKLLSKGMKLRNFRLAFFLAIVRQNSVDAF